MLHLFLHYPWKNLLITFPHEIPKAQYNYVNDRKSFLSKTKVFSMHSTLTNNLLCCIPIVISILSTMNKGSNIVEF